MYSPMDISCSVLVISLAAGELLLVERDSVVEDVVGLQLR